jgi:hypothetical protein
MIFAAKVLLRTSGFGRTIRYLRRLLASSHASTDVGPAIAQRMERAVATAGALYPGRGLCLEQSLVLYYILRRRGLAAKYCQGVQSYPFTAHAWVEYRGAPLNDVAEHVARLARLPDLLP